MSEDRFGGGGVYETSLEPPSADEYKRQWSNNYKNRDIEYQKKMDKNRKQAIKEILQDQVKNAVTPDNRLNDIFHKQIGK